MLCYRFLQPSMSFVLLIAFVTQVTICSACERCNYCKSQNLYGLPSGGGVPCILDNRIDYPVKDYYPVPNTFTDCNNFQHHRSIFRRPDKKICFNNIIPFSPCAPKTPSCLYPIVNYPSFPNPGPIELPSCAQICPRFLSLLSNYITPVSTSGSSGIQQFTVGPCPSPCQSPCQPICETPCQPPCQSPCQVPCQTPCQPPCQPPCQVPCQTPCQSSCQSSPCPPPLPSAATFPTITIPLPFPKPLPLPALPQLPLPPPFCKPKIKITLLESLCPFYPEVETISCIINPDELCEIKEIDAIEGLKDKKEYIQDKLETKIEDLENKKSKYDKEKCYCLCFTDNQCCPPGTLSAKQVFLDRIIKTLKCLDGEDEWEDYEDGQESEKELCECGKKMKYKKWKKKKKKIEKIVEKLAGE